MLCSRKQIPSCYGPRWMPGLNKHSWKRVLFSLPCPTVELHQQVQFYKLTVSLCIISDHGITWTTFHCVFDSWQRVFCFILIKRIKTPSIQNYKECIRNHLDVCEMQYHCIFIPTERFCDSCFINFIYETAFHYL